MVCIFSRTSRTLSFGPQKSQPRFFLRPCIQPGMQMFHCTAAIRSRKPSANAATAPTVSADAGAYARHATYVPLASSAGVA